MTASAKSPNTVPLPLVIGLVAIVVGGVVWQLVSTKPVADAPELPVLVGTTEIAQLLVISAGSGKPAPILTRGDLVLGADGTLWTAWLEFDGTVGHLRVAQSTDAGKTFGPTETLIVSGGPSHFGTPVRLAAEADGDVVLGAMNHRLMGPSPMQDQLVTIFRRAAAASEWSALPEAESLGVPGSLRLQSLAAHRDGALVAIARHEVHFAADSKTRADTNELVIRDLQPGLRTPLLVPVVLQDNSYEAVLWAAADGATLIACPGDRDTLYQSKLDADTGNFGPEAVLHQAEVGHQLRLESLLQASDGSAALHVSEGWQIIPAPDYFIGLEQTMYHQLPQDARQRRDRLLWRGNSAGALTGPIRIKARAIEGVGRGLDAIPMDDGWLLVGRQYEFGNFRDPEDRDRIRLVSIGVDAQGNEGPLSILWEDPDPTISGSQFSNPVRFADGSWVIVVSNRDKQKLPRKETMTLFRYAPSAALTE